MRSGARIWAKPILARSGNSGSCSRRGPSSADRQARHVGDEERRVRIAHAGGRRIGHRPRREVEMQRVHRPRQRDVGPVEPRRPHIDAHPPVGQRLGGQVAGDGADDLRRAGPVSRASRSTTQRVALPQAPASAPSGLRMRMKASALRVRRRRLDGDELVAADAGAPVGDRGRARAGSGRAGRRARRTRRSRCRSRASLRNVRSWSGYVWHRLLCESIRWILQSPLTERTCRSVASNAVPGYARPV